jgi:adenine-specific DNA glycosylase
MWCRRGGRSATTSGRDGCSRSRERQWRATAASCHPTRRRCAFGKRAAILDTNVARVLYRVFVGDGDPKGHAMQRHLWDLSRAVLPVKHVFDFNQALMDFGATVCTARKPQCLYCPMQRHCTWRTGGNSKLEI